MKKRVLSLVLTLAMVLSLAPMALAADSYLWPVPASKKVNQNYHSGHKAIDIGGSLGTDVVATKTGTVYYVYTGCVNKHALTTKKTCTSAGCNPNCGTYVGSSGIRTCNWGYGNGVVIQHSDGSGYSMYAHLNSVSVKKGAAVTQGQKIGTMGSAGNSTGTHLHFELAKNMTMSGTYCKPSNPINNSTSAIAYTSAPGTSSTTPPSSTTKATVTFSPSVDAAYKEYAFTTDTNAGIVTKVTKSSGVTCTYMGVYLYDADGSLIKKQSDKIDQGWITPARSTPYHTWYDINAELGLTLTPGTLYQYQFFGVFAGQEVKDNLRTFMTTGTPPAVVPPEPPQEEPQQPPQQEEPQEEPVVPQPVTIAYYAFGSMIMREETYVGSRYSSDYMDFPDYEFVGWFTSPQGGQQITSADVITETSPRSLYAHYEPIATEPEPNHITLTIGKATMYLNGEPRSIDNEGTVPLIRNNSTLLPVRAVFESMGGTVGWDGVARVVTLTLDSKSLYLAIDSTVSWDSQGNFYSLTTAPTIINNRTMLPIRFVVEYFGGTVDWDGDTRTVLIYHGEKN